MAYGGYGGGGSFEQFLAQAHRMRMQDMAQQQTFNSWYQMAEQLQEQGNELIRQNKATSAVHRYTKALEWAESVPDNDRQIATLLSNRSTAYSKLRRDDAALKDAMECIPLSPTWYKGYWRCAQILKATREWGDALEVLFDGLDRCNEMGKDVRVNFVSEILKNLANMRPDQAIGIMLDRKPQVTKETWSGVVRDLVLKDEWEALFIFILVRTAAASKGMERLNYSLEYSAVGVSLHALSDERSTVRQRGPTTVLKVALELITHGADASTLCRPGARTTPLHVALITGLCAGSFELLEHLLKHVYRTTETRDVQDAEGNTLYHALCRAASDMRHDVIQKAAALLIRYQVEGAASVRNKEGKMAVDLLPAKHQLRSLLIPETLKSRVDSLKDEGNALHKKRKYAQAVTKYTEAIDAIKSLDAASMRAEGVTQRDLAVLYSNRCASNTSKGASDQALKDAVKCTKADENWFRGHVRIGKLNKDQGRHDTALSAYTAAFDCLKREANERDWQVDVFYEVVLLVELMFARSQTAFYEKTDAETHLQGTKPPSNVVTAVMERLSAGGRWRAMYLLCTTGLTRNVNLKNVEMQKMFTVDLDDEWRVNWSLYLEELVIELLRRKAPLSDVNFRALDADTPLHTAAVIAVITDSAKLLEYLLQERSVPVNQPSRNGLPVLHSVASLSACQGRSKTLKILLDNGCDPEKRDCHGNRAVDYLDPRLDTSLQIFRDAYAKREKEERNEPKSRSSRNRSAASATQQSSRSTSVASGRSQTPPEQHRSAASATQSSKYKSTVSTQTSPEQQKNKADATTQHGMSGQSVRSRQQGAPGQGETPHNKQQQPPPPTKPTRKTSQPDKCNCNKTFGQVVAAKSNGDIGSCVAHCRNILQQDDVHQRARHEEWSSKALRTLTDIYDNAKRDAVRHFVDLPASVLERILMRLVSNHRWTRVVALLTDAQERSDERVALGAAIDVTAYIESNHSLSNPHQRAQHLELLLASGARVDAGCARRAAQRPDYPCLPVLLRHGAPPADLVLKEGTTPLHAALHIGLELDKGNFEVLETLFKLREGSPDLHADLDPQTQDAGGNTVFHVAARVSYSKHALRAVELMCAHRVNPNIRNHAHKTAFECLTKRNDRRAQFIRNAGRNFAREKKPAEPERSVRVVDTAVDPGVESGSDAQPKSKTAPSTSSTAKTVNKKEECRRNIERMIAEMPDYEELQEQEEEEEPEDDDESDAGTEPETVEVAEMRHGEDGSSDEAGPEEDAASSSYYSVEPSAFDNLDWDVECPAQVWKLLREKLDHELKKIVVHKIQLLAQGERWNSLVRLVKGTPPDIKLYYTKLGKGRYILWELAIAFSPERSESAERRLGLETQVEHGAEGGRIYTEVIRIWDIVLNRHHMKRTIELIIKSHDRGGECLLQKQLKGIDRSCVPSPRNKRLPQQFTEERDATTGAVHSKETQRFFPPASANQTEYHIIKFYNFSSALVKNIMEAHHVKVDFPFRVTELEHAIIHLRSRPAAPVLLLGRSGTGKTTCCLYRCFDQFVRYWETLGRHGRALERRPVFLRDAKRDQQEECQDAEEETLESHISQKTSRVTGVGAELVSGFRGDEGAEDAGAGDAPSQQGDSEGTPEPQDGACEVGAGGDHQRSASPKQDEKPIIMDHLHQLFITKNAVLCHEVKKNFQEMSRGCQAARAYVKTETLPPPNRLQDAHPNGYPLFLTSRAFLLMLDASLPGTPFFERREDGSMKRSVLGWGEGEGLRVLIPNMEEDDDDDPAQLEGAEEAAGAQHREVKRQDARREVTYEVFAHELWTRINKKAKTDYHPSLVWMEIQSFIQGCLEALNAECGFLTRDQYKQLGRKRAPNFTGNRDTIYDLFLQYRHVKRQLQLFDEQDFVYHVYTRMSEYKGEEWVIHQVYVDETQDFTQAELSLLISCCQNPNDMFLTGDTAQSIMRGVSFRFEDLKTLFYEARRSMKALGKTEAVKVPRKMYQLTHNYRSHSGILMAASSVINLMVHFFPDSFDRLEPDQGLFDGPRPVLLESCSVQDLAMLLSGSRRQASRIEFGAHQAILVVNDETRDALPEELKFAIVLTIFESKGLEFDDILLYNFFKDSQARKEWRVVTEHLNEIVENHKQNRSKDSLYELDLAVLENTQRPRPLRFDPDRQKILNSELKHLYTALTRARVNVWVFDEDREARAPMFEYWKVLDLVQIIKTQVVEGSGEDGSEPQRELLPGVFAAQSSVREWRRRGDEFFRRRLYELAAKCYRHGEEPELEKLSLAQHKAQQAAKLRENPRKMRDEYVFAAELYFTCDHKVEGAACLQNAREYLLAAQVWEKAGQYKRSAAAYERAGRMLDAVKLFETLRDYRRAIQILVDNSRFDAAIDVLKRYEMFDKELKEKKAVAPPDMTRPLERHTLENLSYSAAKIYHKNGETSKMLNALESLPSNQDRINFLLEKSYMDEALPIMKREGQLKEIVKRLRDAGRITDALEYADRDTCPELRAGLLMDLARISFSGMSAESTQNEKDTVIKQVKEVIELVRGCQGDSESYLTGEAMVLLAMVTDESDSFKDALGYCGRKELKILEVELYEHGMQRHGRAFPGTRVAAQFNNLLALLRTIRTQTNPLERKYYADTLKYYGLEESKMDTTKKTLIVRKSEGARIVKLHSKHPQETGSHAPLLEGTMDAALAHKIIMWSIIEKLEWWYRVKVNILKEDAERLTQCEVFVTTGGTCGKPAGQCPYMHDLHTRPQFEALMKTLAALIAFDAGVTHRMLPDDRLMKDDAIGPTLRDLFENKVPEEWFWCRRLMEVVFPTSFQPQVASWNVRQASYIVQWVREHSPPTREALKRYADHLWETLDERNRHCNTDVLTQILNVMMLCGEKTQQLFAKLCKCEDDAMKRRFKFNWRTFFTFKANGETRYLSFFRSLLDFIENIYHRVNERKQREAGDALQASKHMMDFLSFTAKNCFLPIVPSFSNAVTAMELQFVLLTGMLLRHKRDMLLIFPRSYVCLTNWYDAMCGQRGVTIETAVSKYYASKDKLYMPTGRLRTLVQLLTGFYRSEYGAARFNMLVDVFSETGIQSGEAERVLVMALTLLLNCGPTSLIPLDLPPTFVRDRSVYPPEDMIRIALQYINMDGVAMPQRLKGALQAARDATTKRDVLMALRGLLANRQDEALYLGSWGTLPNYTYGVVYHKAPLNPSFLAERQYGYIDMTPVIQARAQFKVVHSPVVQQEMEPVGDEEPEADMLELSEAEVAQLVQQQTTHEQQQQAEDNEVNPAPNDCGMVNDNVCLICDAHFVQAYQGGFEGAEGEDGVEEGTRENASVTTTWTSQGETRGDHEMSEFHRNQVALFVQFQMGIRQMEPCMAECASTLNLNFVSSLSGDAATLENIRSEIMQAQGMKISDLRREMISMTEHVHQIESNRKWSEINDVMRRAIRLKNECETLVAHSNLIARQNQEQKVVNHHDDDVVVRDSAIDDGGDAILEVEQSLRYERTRYRSRRRQAPGRHPVGK